MAYYALTTVVIVGYGDVTPGTNMERLGDDHHGVRLPPMLPGWLSQLGRPPRCKGSLLPGELLLC